MTDYNYKSTEDYDISSSQIDLDNPPSSYPSSTSFDYDISSSQINLGGSSSSSSSSSSDTGRDENERGHTNISRDYER